MEGAQRDNTEDWLVPRHSVPTVSELEARIGEALVIARTSEEGVREVGEIALDAARQARRAAEAAEASARAVVEARSTELRPAGPVSDGALPPGGGSPPSSPPAGGSVGQEAPAQVKEESPSPQPAEEISQIPQPRFEVRFRSFNERADRVAARLRALEEHPRHPAAASVGAGRLRGDG